MVHVGNRRHTTFARGKTKGVICDADSRCEFELREGEKRTKMQVEAGKAASRP